MSPWCIVWWAESMEEGTKSVVTIWVTPGSVEEV